MTPAPSAARRTRVARPADAVRRQLGAPQMAFVRSWAEGLDLVAAWNRWLSLDGPGDARRARGELQRLLDELRALARAHGRADIAALLQRDPEAMVDAGPPPPSLEDFARRHPPDFYGEAELAALYEAEFGARGAARDTARRRQRLRQRLLAALQWLEQVGTRAPRPDDPVEGWLDARVARRLAVVGIRTLGELQRWISTKGFHWHRRIPRLGAQGAARIVRWMQTHADALGALPAASLQPRRSLDLRQATPAACTGIVPLERFTPPPGRDGAQGLNRAPPARCRIAAADDLQAVQAWLALRPADSHTWRAYRKEAERFLLWSVLVRRKALSSLDGQDCLHYRDFIAAPPADWVAPGGTQRWSEAWRPFAGPLSAGSQATAVSIVRSLCAWLVRRHYLDANPWDDVPARGDAPPAAPLRAFTPQQWALIVQWIDDAVRRAPSAALHRLKFLLDFGAMSGLRLAELAAARLGWLRQEPLHISDDGPGDGAGERPGDARAWSIRVPGRRGTSREVPLPAAAVRALRVYLGHRGLAGDPAAHDPALPLVSRLDGTGGLSASRIHDVLRDGFERCAATVHATDPAAAARIRAGSTHWLRHTYGAHTIAQGVPPEVVQDALGHRSPAATAVYLRHDRARRHRALQAAFADPGEPTPR